MHLGGKAMKAIHPETIRLMARIEADIPQHGGEPLI
jgi:hypothetical protein